MMQRSFDCNNNIFMQGYDSIDWRFRDELFVLILIPTIEHIPWALRNIPIPPGIYDRIISIICKKMASGVYESSSASY
jgi:hypothetical protein